MKQFTILLFVLMGVLTSCSSDNSEMDEMSMIEDEKIYQGNFISVAHPTSGIASTNKEKTMLEFKNFKTDDGPKLDVYLSKESNPDNYINLGELKGIEGDFTHDLPENVNLSEYKFVVIWCVEFSVSFGHAELK
ncbi:DM13 domain-containing protein [Namhaeicola litoreus]|uniref:DM13 domain-containing protein n=1 Tax=Namhaeicola litoreus TaxID=1052145 RepID=A0ABW3XYY1_9FLAO